MNIEALKKKLEFDAKLHSERGNELYADYQHAEKYRLVIAGKTAARRENARLRPIIEQMLKVVEAAQISVNQTHSIKFYDSGNDSICHKWCDVCRTNKELRALDKMVME